MKLKGISLSIETIVIIIVCVLVLVVTVLFFSGVFNPGAETVADQAALSKECLEWGWHNHDNDYFKAHLEDYPALSNTFSGDPVKAEKYCKGEKE